MACRHTALSRIDESICPADQRAVLGSASTTARGHQLHPQLSDAASPGLFVEGADGRGATNRSDAAETHDRNILYSYAMPGSSTKLGRCSELVAMDFTSLCAARVEQAVHPVTMWCPTHVTLGGAVVG